MICGYHHKLLDCAREPECRMSTAYGSAEVEPATIPFAIVDTASRKSKELDLLTSCHGINRIMGKPVKDLSTELGSAKPVSGKMYRVLNLHTKSFSEPLWVTGVSTDSLGITKVTVSQYGSDKCIHINPDYTKYDRATRTIGNGCVWVEVASTGTGDCRCADESLELGNQRVLMEYIFDQGYKRA
jgi:hypothetical protein